MLAGALTLLLPVLFPITAPVISPADPRIVYVGRFDRREPKAPACQWPASEVRLRVQGRSLVVRMDEKGNDGWAVEVDGKPTDVVTPKPGEGSYTIQLGADAVHEVRLIKRTEAFVGTTRFLGFEVPNGRLQKALPKQRHIEFVGDSITCGFGDEGANQDEPFKNETENASMSYASVAARMVNADPTLLAWSGRKMWPNNTMPEIYDRVLPTEAAPLYDFKGPAPDVVVIHLATNDFGKENPEEKGWTDAYEAFIRRVWSHYPKAHVYAAIGSMMSDNYPPGHEALSTVRRYLTGMIQRMNDPRLHMIEFEVQKMEDGIGSGWHPNLKTHQKMGAGLAAVLRRDLGW